MFQLSPELEALIKEQLAYEDIPEEEHLGQKMFFLLSQHELSVLHENNSFPYSSVYMGFYCDCPIVFTTVASSHKDHIADTYVTLADPDEWAD